MYAGHSSPEFPEGFAFLQKTKCCAPVIEIVTDDNVTSLLEKGVHVPCYTWSPFYREYNRQ